MHVLNLPNYAGFCIKKYENTKIQLFALFEVIGRSLSVIKFSLVVLSLFVVN